MFRPRNTVMPPKNQLSQPQSSRNTVMLKKIQTFKEFSSGLAIDARILELLEFFEHYSVSCAPCPKNHESVDS